MGISRILRQIRSLTIYAKLTIVGLGGMLTAMAIVVVGIWQGNVFGNQAVDVAERLIDRDLDHITESIYNLIRAQDESLQKKINADLNVARYTLQNHGEIRLSDEMVHWRAINQFNRETIQVELPKMMVGERWLGQNNQLWVQTPVVDDVKRLVGGTATIFQRMNDSGDMLRVATNVEDNDGTRAIGTYIPAVNPDGTPNPVISAVMRGNVYRGNAYVVNAWYVTAYEPIYDESSNIIGVLYVGVKQENVQALRQAISQVVVGKTGYVFIIGGKGEYIISKGGRRDGENLLDTKDSNGNHFVREMLDKAKGLKPGDFATHRYSWQNTGEPKPLWKIVRLSYYQPWDWVIGTSAYEDEIQMSLTPLTKGYQTMVRTFSLVALSIALLCALLAWLLARSISRPLLTVTRAATQLTEKDLPRLIDAMQAVDRGDLTATFHLEMSAVAIDSEDELGTLAKAFTSMNTALITVGEAFNRMVHNLNELTTGLEQRVQERTGELRESERQLADIIDFLPDATVVIDRDGKIIAWNRAIEEMTGFSAADMVGKGEHEYALPFYGERIPILIDLVNLSDKEIEDRYTSISRKDNVLTGEAHVPLLKGKPAYIFATASALYNSKGAIIGAIETIRDYTERKRVEEELEKARIAAESANKSKSAFLATMSHEIRTPMNGIIGMTSLLLDTPLSSEQKDFVETIRCSGETLLTIINDILDFSKIEAQKIELEQAPFSTRDCVENALELVAHKAAAKNIELAFLTEANVPTAIIGDRTRLQQIILNLLGNAVKFTEKGEVVVKLKSRALSPPSEDGASGVSPGIVHELQFSVQDTGIGIPSDRLDRLFKSFSQVDASTTRRFGGTGLGLAISKRLVEMMGGRMWVESDVGWGSKFFFTIQARTAACALPTYLAGQQPSLQGKRVVIVDDNETNRKILKLQAQSWGMVPLAFDSGQAALAYLEENRAIDLMLIDMHMPDMDGLMLAESLKKNPATMNLPLVLATSIGLLSRREWENLFAACLTKPIKASQLFNTLTELFVRAPEEASIPSEGPEGQGFDSDMAKHFPLRILVAEDNAINQKLALLTLERLGYVADVAGNGLEALSAVQRQKYDLILMDVQMPEMDGLEATGRIRQTLPDDRQPYIVAMTANAMQGDREQCLAARMDDYITKPFQVERLIEAMKGAHRRLKDRNRPRTPQPNGRPPETEAPEAASCLDQAALRRLKATLGKRADAMLPALIGAFLKDASALIAQAHKAWAEGLHDELRRSAHTLKSNARNFGAIQLGELCQELETMAKEGQMDGAKGLLERIDAEYKRVTPAIRAL